MHTYDAMRCCGTERLFHQYYDQEQLKRDSSSDSPIDVNVEPVFHLKQKDSPVHLKRESPQAIETLGPETLPPDR